MFFKKKKSESLIGQIVDSSIKDFKTLLKEKHYNIGMLKNLQHYLTGSYSELVGRKDVLIKSLDNKDLSKKDRKAITKSVKGIYSELIKIERKCIYLTDRIKELADVDCKENAEFDTSKK